MILRKLSRISFFFAINIQLCGAQVEKKHELFVEVGSSITIPGILGEFFEYKDPYGSYSDRSRGGFNLSMGCNTVLWKRQISIELGIVQFVQGTNKIKYPVMPPPPGFIVGTPARTDWRNAKFLYFKLPISLQFPTSSKNELRIRVVPSYLLQYRHNLMGKTTSDKGGSMSKFTSWPEISPSQRVNIMGELGIRQILTHQLSIGLVVGVGILNLGLNNNTEFHHVYSTLSLRHDFTISRKKTKN
jgi:hypothetical protein